MSRKPREAHETFLVAQKSTLGTMEMGNPMPVYQGRPQKSLPTTIWARTSTDPTPIDCEAASPTDNGVDETLAATEPIRFQDPQTGIHRRAKGSQRHGAVAFFYD
jgi:hypothetical protein